MMYSLQEAMHNVILGMIADQSRKELLNHQSGILQSSIHSKDGGNAVFG